MSQVSRSLLVTGIKEDLIQSLMLKEEIKPLGHVNWPALLHHCLCSVPTKIFGFSARQNDRNSALGSTNQVRVRALLLIRLLCDQRGNLVFLLLLLLQQPAGEKRDSPAGIPTEQGPHSNSTGWGWLPAMCVCKQAPTAPGAQILLSPGTAQRLWHRARLAAGSCLLPQHVLCHGHLGEKG